MTRESFQKKLKQQEERLNQTRQFFYIDQSHPMVTKADEIQKLINEINDDLCYFPDDPSYGSIINNGPFQDAVIRRIKSQIDQLRNAMIIRN